MPILRAQKEELVTKLTEELQNSRVALVFAYTALNMKANDTLRTRAFEGGAKVKMISNTLLAIILKNIGKSLEIPQKTLALAYGFEDEVIAAKTLVEFAKETETLEVLGGWVDGNFFDASQVKTLATLPNKETLQAQLVGRLNGLIGGLAYSLNFPIQKLAFVIEAVKNAQPAVEVRSDESKPEQKVEAPAPTEEQSTDEEESAAPTAESAEETKTVDTPAEPAEEKAEESDSSEEAAKSEEIQEESKEETKES
ncbi:MAG: 50S ribosomal protein L10 [bacterium]|nr:50S ribosomal protein L10 [bacterium]